MAKKISFFTIGIILILLVVSERISLKNSMDLLRQSLEQRARTVALTSAHLTAEALAMNFLSFLQEEVVEIQKANPDVIYALIVDSERSILAHTDEEKVLSLYPYPIAKTLDVKWTDDFVELQAPIISVDKIEGNVIFSIDTTLLKKARSRMVVNSIIKLGSVILVGILLSFWVVIRIVRPLNILSSYAQDFSTHDFSRDDATHATENPIKAIPLKNKDEVGRLGRFFHFYGIGTQTQCQAPHENHGRQGTDRR